MKHEPLTFEYSQITKYIYVGTNLCCETHFNKSLLKKEIRADVSLEEKRIDTPFGVDYYLWLPTKDHQAPTLKQLEVGVAFMKKVISQKVKCYVHCQRGHGRAPTLVAAYLVSEGMSVKDTISFIKKKRPSIHPNKRQITMIEKFKKKYTTNEK